VLPQQVQQGVADSLGGPGGAGRPLALREIEALSSAAVALATQQRLLEGAGRLSDPVVGIAELPFLHRRCLRAYQRRGGLEKPDREEMVRWDHGGGFSGNASVRIEAHERCGVERLLRYCARPPFAAERLEELDAHRLVYHRPKPGPHGRTQLILSSLELIERIAVLVPPPRQHRHQCFGVLAPNCPLPAAVTALAREAVAPQPAPPPARPAPSDDPPQALGRSAARYLWAVLLARLDEARGPEAGAEGAAGGDELVGAGLGRQAGGALLFLQLCVLAGGDVLVPVVGFPGSAGRRSRRPVKALAGMRQFTTRHRSPCA